MNNDLISRSALLNQIDTTDWSDVRLLVEDAPTVEPICPYLSDNEVKQSCLNSPCERPIGDCISRELLKKDIDAQISYFNELNIKGEPYKEFKDIKTILFGLFIGKNLIDNAPTGPQFNVFCENADEKPIEDMKAELQNVLDRERQKGEWIPIKTRPMTEEEKQNAIEEHGIDPGDLEYPFAWHFDCELPKLKEDEQSVDVLVTTALGFVKVTNFFIDYLGCSCFEDMDEAGEFVAWMPMPKSYEGETT